MAEIFNPKVDVVRLANSIVLTPDGKQLKLGRLWQSRPTVIIFLRHFACIACRAHASQFWADRERYKGMSLIFLGNGSPDFIEKFREDLGLGNAVILTDPTLESFRAAGFRHGFRYVLQKDSILNAVKLYRQGHKQATYKKKAGTHWQMGGIMAIKTNGEVTYHYISESLGDFPSEPHIEVITEDEKKKLSDKSKILY